MEDLAVVFMTQYMALSSRLRYNLSRELRVHVIVTNAFLRSLARLELAPSVVGTLRARADRAAAAGDIDAAADATALAAAEERSQASSIRPVRR